MSVKIFVMTHKPFTPPTDSMYVPLHVGRANAADLGYLGDDSGDSISAFNANFCELTGMYWLWKNYHASDYIGICHYRRYLIDETEAVFTEEKLQELLSAYDIITTKLLTLTCSYEEGFRQNHHFKDLVTTGRILNEKYPEYTDTFQTLLHGPNTYFGNIFITSKETYDDYCSWLFDILLEVQKHTDFTGYNNYQKRLFGFLSEFLQTVWIQFHKLRVYECKVGMIGEKYETKKLRRELAGFFENKDYNGAKNCFLDSYKKRPDVLMEASDVTGELRLCMQIISVCSFEDEMYHHCILDDICDYDRLISHFHKLNTIVCHFLTGAPNEDDLLFLKQRKCITPASIAVTAKIFCKDSVLQQNITEKMCSYLCTET